MGIQQLHHHMASLSTWYRLWREELSDIKTPTDQRFTKCATCTAFKTHIEQCRNHAYSKVLLARLILHYEAVK